jgi:hypothetical protein
MTIYTQNQHVLMVLILASSLKGQPQTLFCAFRVTASMFNKPQSTL